MNHMTKIIDECILIALATQFQQLFMQILYIHIKIGILQQEKGQEFNLSQIIIDFLESQLSSVKNYFFVKEGLVKPTSANIIK